MEGKFEKKNPLHTVCPRRPVQFLKYIPFLITNRLLVHTVYFKNFIYLYIWSVLYRACVVLHACCTLPTIFAILWLQNRKPLLGTNSQGVCFNQCRQSESWFSKRSFDCSMSKKAFPILYTKLLYDTVRLLGHTVNSKGCRLNVIQMAYIPQQE